MKVRELMQTQVRTVRRDDVLPDVVTAMADQHVTALAVMDHDERIIGVISTADVLTAQAESAADDMDWQEIEVEDVMTVPPLTISPDASVAEAAQQLLYADVHRLFVVENGALVGVISQTDLVRAFAAHRLQA